VFVTVPAAAFAAWWWATRSSRALFTPRPGTASLDSEGLVYLLPAFLNNSEVLQLRTIASTDARFARASMYESVEFFRPWEPRSSDLTRAIEQRIGEVTGIPPHEGDSPLRIAVNRPWPAAHDAPHTSLQNLHHDSNERPRRVATVLVYLSDPEADGLEGGETLFPCAAAGASAARGAAGAAARGAAGASARGADDGPDELCARLKRAYDAGERFLSPPHGMYTRCIRLVNLT